jgi:hypothetical protein
MVTKKKPVIKKENDKLQCRKCLKVQSDTNYYEAVSLLDSNGKMSICKKCIGEIYDDFFKRFNDVITTIYMVCQMVDVKFSLQAIEGLKAHMLKSIEKGVELKSIFGTYKSKISSTCKNNGATELDFSHSDKLDNESDEVKIDEYEFDNDDLKLKWGDYPHDTLIRFERKYEFLKNNYNEKTSMHTEAIYKYVRYSVLEETANELKDTGSAKIYNDLANKAATAAKINPSQLSKADLMDGLNSFSELSAAVERAVDIIKILPKFKYRANDALDFTMWCYINYERNLNGLPEVPYEDVYEFYDKKVEEYITQYGNSNGIFDLDTTKKNREAIKNFIKPFAKDGDD